MTWISRGWGEGCCASLDPVLFPSYPSGVPLASFFSGCFSSLLIANSYQSSLWVFTRGLNSSFYRAAVFPDIDREDVIHDSSWPATLVGYSGDFRRICPCVWVSDG